MNVFAEKAERARRALASPFLGDEVAATDAIHAEFGEPLVHRPMRRRPNYPAEVDPERPVAAITGVFDLEPREMKLGRDGLAVASFDPTVHIAKRWFAEAPRIADVIVRTSTGAEYEVSRVRPTGLASVSLDLVQRGTARPFDAVDIPKGEVVAAETVRKAPRRPAGWQR